MSDLSASIDGLSENRRALLEALLRERASEKKLETRDIPRKPESAPAYLSFSQKRLWILDQLGPGDHAYNITIPISLSGTLNAHALEQSISEIVRRHDILRTTFSNAKNEPVQTVSPFYHQSVQVPDLSGLIGIDRNSVSISLAKVSARRSFNLAYGPLFEAQLLKQDELNHILVLRMHHAVFDLWSLGVFLKELSGHYKSYLGGKPTQFSEPAIQYVDYAYWQHQRSQDKLFDEQLSYWKEHLKGIPPVLELPTDFARPVFQSNVGDRISFSLSEELSKKLRQLSKDEGVTLFMTLLSSFAVLLHRYAGQNNIVVGTPIACRTSPQLESLLGFFANTLVLHIKVSPHLTFSELLRQVRDIAVDGYSHQDVPFERLVEELNPERSLGRNPIFQVMFSMQNVPFTLPDFPGLSARPIDLSTDSAMFDLSLDLADDGHEITGSLEFNVELFRRPTIARIIEHFKLLVESVTVDKDQTLSSLTFVTEPERHQMLREWNVASLSVPDICIHTLFESQVERSPDVVAAVFAEDQLTYAELNRRANLLAHYMRRLGIGSEMTVGIYLDQTLDALVCVLATLKAGGAYVPLDRSYPPQRLAYMLEDAQVALLLTKENYLKEITIEVKKAICIDRDASLIELENEENPINHTHPSGLAYTIYTSGSTGNPKGVMLAHAGVINAYLGWEQAYELRTAAYCHLQIASFSFDVFTGDLMRALCSGARILFCPRSWLLAPEKLYRLFVEGPVDCVDLGPVVMRQLLAYLQKNGKSLTALRIFVGGADTWNMAEYRQVVQLTGTKTRVLNSYGVTEATVDSTYFEWDGYEWGPSDHVPIGHPFPNTRIHLCDETLSLVPIGNHGEIYIGGIGLARGYLGKPNITAEKFIPDFLSVEPGQRLYKTGDLGKRHFTGEVEFLGRTDYQVKIRGFRIEIGEIELLLKEHPGVSEAVVLARGSDADKRLAAYIVTDHHSPANVSDLRAFLKSKLPDHSIPSAFVMLDKMPVTPNGKIDRRALPAPDQIRPELENKFVAPRTAVETVVAGIWAELLKLEQVGISDNFFELGGHSLLAVQVLAEIHDCLQVELPLYFIFDKPTVADISDLILETSLDRSKTEQIAELIISLSEASDDEIDEKLNERLTAGAR